MDKIIVDLAGWTIIKISGPEKKVYLNGIITFDLDKLNDKTICQSMFLTPKAKIRSIFWLLESNEEYFLYVPAKMKLPLIEDLLKYKLDTNVKLEDITEETPHLYLIEKVAENNSSIQLGGRHFNFEQSDEQMVGPINYQKFIEWLVIHGESPVELLVNENPFEVGLAAAVTLEKGCFLGQEPLSRMYHRGRPRQFLYQITSENDLPDQILQSSEEVGRVISRITNDNEHFVLSMIKSSVKVQPDTVFDNISYKSIVRIGSYPDITR